MPDSAAPPSPAAPPSAALLAAWLAHSTELLALTDRAGSIRWCNPAFERATGLSVDGVLASAVPRSGDEAASPEASTTALQRSCVADPEAERALRTAGGATLWVQMRVARVADELLWTLRDTTASHALAVRAQRLSELLETAQEFGRLGIWERDLTSGTGRWDRHVFRFWGLDPEGGTPDYPDAAAQVHPDDRSRHYLDSTRRAGRYAERYRVVRPDGKTRWIHSQWEVKNSAQGTPERAVGIMVDDTAVYELARSRDATVAQLKVATELVDLVIWRHDLVTDRIHYNDHGFKVLGIAPKADGLSLAEARARMHPDDVAKLAASSAHALATGVPIDVEVRHRRDDGTWRYMLVRSVIERDDAGAVIAFVGVTLDVTAQVEQSRRAEQLTRRLEAAAEAARVGIWTTVVGTLQTEWNAQMYELFDLAVSGGPPTLSEWLDRCVHADDVARVTQTTRAFLKRETRAFEIEFRIRTRDGRVRWMVLRADLDRSGLDPTRVFGIAMDVTERHDALDALHAASERAALIARHAGIGTWETDDHGPALWDAQMWQLRGLAPRPVALGREERLALAHPDDRAHVLDSNPELDGSARPTAYDFRVLLPDGSYRCLASRSSALQDERGKVIRRVGVNWDITEAKNAELARQQALLAERESQAKSQFLSRMSHELRTPLNAVLGFTQLLQLEAGSADAGDAHAIKLGHIRAAGEHLLTLIDDALDLSSLQSGTLRLDLRAVPLATAVAQAMPLVEALAETHRVTLQRGAIEGSVRADPTRLRQVLLNLLTNAIKYNRPGGRVVVDSAVDGEQVRMSVRDTGRGLNPEQLSHLFEPFNRLGVESEGIEGSGIGLTIVKALLEGMGGQIGAFSEAGRGTVFELVLPQAERAAPAPSPALDVHAQMIGAAPAPARSGSLLYIEDNSVNVLLVEELVRSLSGLGIVSEATGAAGVARARTLRPDLILVDMQLPDFDGFEVLRQLRSHAETAAIRCIALSANAMPDDIARGLAGGFDDYWTKPIRFKPFLEALDRLFPPAAAA